MTEKYCDFMGFSKSMSYKADLRTIGSEKYQSTTIWEIRPFMLQNQKSRTLGFLRVYFLKDRNYPELSANFLTTTPGEI